MALSQLLQPGSGCVEDHICATSLDVAVRRVECGQQTLQMPSSVGIQLSACYKLPVSSSLENELDLNSACLFAIYLHKTGMFLVYYAQQPLQRK